MKYAIYDLASTGDAARIIQTVSGIEDDAEADAGALGLSYTEIPESADDRTHYIKPSTGRANTMPLTPCTPNAETVPADGTTPVKLSRMRVDTSVVVTGPVTGKMTCSGTDTITFAEPGRYTITATAPWPALPKEIVIDAT